MPREIKLKTRDKKTHKMTRDGLVEQNQTTGQEQRISQRLQDVSFEKTGAAEPMAGGRARHSALSACCPAKRKTAHFVRYPATREHDEAQAAQCFHQSAASL